MTDQQTELIPAREVELSVQGVLSAAAGLHNLITEEGHTLEAQDLMWLRSAINMLLVQLSNAELEQQNVH